MLSFLVSGGTGDRMSTSLRYVDAHIHLSDPEYAGCVDEVVAEARAANVVAMVSNSVDLQTGVGSIKLAERYGGLVFAAVGVHPWNVQTISDEEVEAVVKLAEENRNNKALVAIGEIGLDSKYVKVWEKQLKVLDTMLRLAERLDLPACVHSRGVTEQVVDLLPSYGVKRVLLHWFSGSLQVLDKTVDRGYYVSEGPAVVYSNVLRDIVRRVPLTRLLTETDGPTRYHKPPFNAKTTTPATHMPTVVQSISEIRLDNEETAKQIIETFGPFFRVRMDSEAV